jgi:hypothetical protein
MNFIFLSELSIVIVLFLFDVFNSVVNDLTVLFVIAPNRVHCKITIKCVKDPVGFINVLQIYPNMFRQVVAIFRGS